MNLGIPNRLTADFFDCDYNSVYCTVSVQIFIFGIDFSARNQTKLSVMRSCNASVIRKTKPA